MKILSFFCFLSLLIHINAKTADGPNYPCRFVEQKPEIDGVLDDACWKNLPKAKGFFSLTDGYVLWRQTEFQACRDNSSLYLGIKAYEPYVDRLKPKQSDGDNLFSDDSIELFFQPEGKKEYSQLIANSIGKRWNKKYPARSEAAEPLWNWKAKSSKGKRCWFLEIEIPFSVLNKPPLQGKKWRVNIARNSVIGTNAERYSSWPLLKKGFHDTENYGTFTFTAPDAPQEEVRAYNDTQSNYPEIIIKKLAQKYPQCEPLLKEAESLIPQTERKELNEIKRKWALTRQIAKGKWTPQEMSEALKSMRGLEEKTEEFKYIVLLEKLIKEAPSPPKDNEDKTWKWDAYGIPKTDNPACIPTKRYAKFHYALKEKAQKQKPDIIFIGDSITQLWNKCQNYPCGEKYWEKYFKPMNALNYGISGDTTGDVLWRLTEGKALDGLTPKLVILLIGTNNLHKYKKLPPEKTAEGIAAIVKLIRKKLPNATILLYGIFPRDKTPQGPHRKSAAKVNKIIAGLDDPPHIFYTDIGKKFIEPNGEITKETLRDYLHLTEKGYQVWAEEIINHPAFKNLSKSEAK